MVTDQSDFSIFIHIIVIIIIEPYIKCYALRLL